MGLQCWAAAGVVYRQTGWPLSPALHIQVSVQPCVLLQAAAPLPGLHARQPPAAGHRCRRGEDQQGHSHPLQIHHCASHGGAWGGRQPEGDNEERGVG